jgi:hypothetical protein
MTVARWLARPGPDLWTILTQGFWITGAILALALRQFTSNPEDDELTFVALFACTTALAVVVKDDFVGAKWSRRLNVAALALPLLLLLFLLFTAHQSTLGPLIYVF